ncbi:hypothetical protein GBA52_007458 [Prunus armeniaca]|nr:hypothetical protein GBA52_007458 [Prunus armeniaca]
MEDLTAPLRSNDESDLLSSSCSCHFDPDLPTNPAAIGGDGDRSKCPSCSKSLKAPEDDKEDCSELNHPDDTTTRTECAACSKGNSELCSSVNIEAGATAMAREIHQP